MIRLFAAVPIPQDIGLALVRRQTGLDGARWRTLDQLHVTLRFFGEVREDVARDLDGELSAIGGGPFELELQGAGAFGEGDEIRAIWAGVVDNPALKHLAQACESAARRVGLKPEKRNYRPHVTLAYLRHADPAKVAAWIQGNNLLRSPPMAVESFGLYSSVLAKEGAHYRLEAEYPLR
ncbi:RNA 2',3'-cyclic phosphodiesterase [Phenylobacterium deserti]|uniref:RNA 2',3'-cyclic phosphodiesterase n=1 Tax=Phenylobacterium deserti TaxID=1914756 RepID=A0A328AT48_9CAUL|nr:RNA 2',3'-cyclic phosphodiesterase [Phenylobacterium deserti]RAK57441.1 RNA 2',3'-cyclic phosphodiesterase [Phenylobacterium deserti]